MTTRTILCIDDESDLLDEIAALLEDEAYRVLQADDGAKGLEVILAHAPDLVICDITMPGMSGYELCETLRRNHPQHSAMPFIFLSALADRHDVLKGMELGADEYLVKPVDFDILLAKVKAILRQMGRIEEQKGNELAHLASHDALTGLANRVLLNERLSEATRAAREGHVFAVLFIDLDRFKTINDTLGHSVGDELLKVVGNRLSECVRDTDTVARLGGDEFAVVQTSARDPGEAAILAQRILEELRRPLELTDHQVRLNASIGIALAPSDGLDPEELIKYADLALYEAKRLGRGQYLFFEATMAERMEMRRSFEADLRVALERDQFELHYQPLHDLKEKKVVGFEALLRWHHPERGMVSPADFIPIAEDTGLINEIGEWVLYEACREATNWPAEFNVAVNVSPIQIKHGTFPLEVVSALAKTGLSAHRLEFELTESIFIDCDEEMLATLDRLRELGTSVVIDDFGTGYCSLSYLKNYPFDKLKIDRAFICDVDGEDQSTSIVRAVAELAKALGMHSTAEGIETLEHLAMAASKGCTHGQGYLLGRPEPAADIARQYFPYYKVRKDAAA